MEELKKINRKVAFKQKGRLIGGAGSVIIGMILIGKFIYQKGITRACLKNKNCTKRMFHFPFS